MLVLCGLFAGFTTTLEESLYMYYLLGVLIDFPGSPLPPDVSDVNQFQQAFIICDINVANLLNVDYTLLTIKTAQAKLTFL